MAFCRNCGKEIEDNAVACNECGAAQVVEATPVETIAPNQTTVEPTPGVTPPPAQPEDKGGFGWGLLGCCIPIVGLILFLVWKDTKPKTSKAAGIGALVSVIASVVIYIIYFVLIVAIGVGAGIMG